MSVTTAVILAAGLGTRLGELAQGLPKGFVELGGETLIARSLRLLYARGITRTVLVTGHGHAAYDALVPCHAGLETVHNAEYATTGSMASLACALEHVSEPFLLLESDLYYEPRALDVLLAAPAPDMILAAGETRAGDEVYVEAALGRLVGLSKRREALSAPCAELVGISKLSQHSAQAMRDAFARFVEKHGHAQMAYETDALVEVARSLPVLVQVVPDLLWGELDDASHLLRLQREVLPQMAAREAYVPASAREILLNPGPATTRDEVKAALLIPDVCPREASFAALYAEVRERLAAMAGSLDEVSALPIPGSGTSALEAMLGSVVGPSDRLLVIDNGDYGARLLQIAERLALRCEVMRCGWAQPLDLQALSARLSQRETRPDFVALVHHETSSGLLNPVAAVAELARAHGAKVLVDAMSSFGALPITVGAAGVAALVSSANKCLEGMAGLAFVLLEHSLLERSRAHRARSFVLDLVAEHDHLRATGQSRFTLPPQIVSALCVALRIHEQEGRAGRQARYTRSMQTLLHGLAELGFSPLLAPEHESQILIAVREPSGGWFDFEQLHAAMRARGFTVYPGKNAALRTFRLSVLGAIDERDIRRFLVELGRFTQAARSRQEASGA